MRGHGFKFHGSPECFSGFLHNCINCVHNCENHSSFVLNITVNNHSVKVTVIHVFITSTLCHIARNYVHRESLDCLIILIQTLFLLLHIQAVLDKRQAMVVEGAQPKRKLARDLEIEMGEDYYMDMREHWDLAKGDEKHDILPEIYLGKNVADFIDPDIMKVRFQLGVVVLKFQFLYMKSNRSNQERSPKHKGDFVSFFNPPNLRFVYFTTITELVI